MSVDMAHNFRTLVQRQLRVRSPNGDEREIVIRIGEPRITEAGGDAACPVEITGLFERLADIHGIDEMDAVRLAIEFVERSLRGSSEQILWPDGEPYG
jgi:hypothetical protein